MEGENKAKNIVLVGLVCDENLGDRAISGSSMKLIKTILLENGRSAELRVIDLYGRTENRQKTQAYSLVIKILNKVKRLSKIYL